MSFKFLKFRYKELEKLVNQRKSCQTEKDEKPGEAGRRSGSSALPPAGPSRQTHDDDDDDDDHDDDDDDHDDDHDDLNRLLSSGLQCYVS